MNKKNVRKIKKGVPITIAYAGDDTNFFLASGGEVTDYESTSIATDGSTVLAPNTFVGSDGEIHTGTMPNNGAKTKQLAINETYTLGKGYYDSITVNQNITTKGSQIYTPSRSDQIIYANQYLNGNQIIKGDADLLGNNIKEGVSIFGVLGTCNVQSMGGVKKTIASSQSEPFKQQGGNAYWYGYAYMSIPSNPSIIVVKATCNSQTFFRSLFINEGNINLYKGDSYKLGVSIESYDNGQLKVECYSQVSGSTGKVANVEATIYS